LKWIMLGEWSAYQVTMTEATRGPSPPPRRTRRRRSFAPYLFWLMIFLALLWLVYWWGAREIAAAALDRVTAAAEARGYKIECTDPVDGGFPVSLDLKCSSARLDGGAGTVTATLDGVDATAPLYIPGRVTWNSDGPLALDLPGDRLSLTAAWGSSRSRIDAGIGGLSALAARVEGLRLNIRPEARPVPFAGATADIADIVFEPAAGSDYRLTAYAKALSPESEGGRHLPPVDLDADIAAVGLGGSLGIDLRATLRAWIEKGGAIRIDKLLFAAGAVSTSTAGMLDMAPGGALSGTLKVNIAGLEALPDLAEAYRPGSREDVAQVAAAVTAFSRPVDTPTGPARELQLTIRNNVVALGIIPIGVVPPLDF
jgi:hypothetical protein